MPQFDPAARELVLGRIQNRPTIGLLDIGPLARVHDGAGAAIWRTRNLESREVCAARGVGDRRGSDVARRARAGRTRAGAMASPMARRRASLAGAGMRLQRKPRPGARESVHRIGLARSLRNACNRRNTRALAAEDAGESKTRESRLIQCC